MIQLSENDKHIPVYLSTHPDTKDRLKILKEKISKHKGVYRDDPHLEQLFQEIKSNN